MVPHKRRFSTFFFDDQYFRSACAACFFLFLNILGATIDQMNGYAFSLSLCVSYVSLFIGKIQKLNEKSMPSTF